MNGRNEKAQTPVKCNNVSTDANVVWSHVVYSRKIHGSAKTRVVLWSYRDKDKGFLSGDAPNVSLEVFYLLLSLAAEVKWLIRQTDIETALLQIPRFIHKIYVQPSCEADEKNVLWKLELAATGPADSRRLWQLTSDKQLIKSFELTCLPLKYILY